jgi:AcrR family transcriptional regulator
MATTRRSRGKARAAPAKEAKAARGRDRDRTHADILDAARRSFATRGYAHSGMRDIAAAAGITPALVVRYFGSKEQLFVAAIDADLGVAPFFELGPRAELGRHIVHYLTHKPAHDVDALSILLLASSDRSLRPRLRKLVQERMVAPVAAWLGGANATGRAALLLAIVSGVWIYRHSLPVAALSGVVDDATGAALARQLQDLVDGG